MLALLADNGLDWHELAWDIVRALLHGFLIAWPVTFALVAILIVSVALGIWRRVRLARSGIKDIDRMGGRLFEQYLEVLFRRLGYRVERTRFAGDYGGDLVLRKDGVRTVVQAKRYSRAVGVRAVQEVVAAKAQYECAEAMVVTNNRFTKQAAHLAERNHVELWDREELTRRLMAAGGRSGLREATQGEEAPRARRDAATCRTCGRELSAEERRYCAENAQRFLGQMFCHRHQRTRRSAS